MASLAFTALRRTILPVMIFAGFVIWQSNEGAKARDLEVFERVCLALAEHHEKRGECPMSLDALSVARTPNGSTHDDVDLAYVREPEACSLAIAGGPSMGHSCQVPK